MEKQNKKEEELAIAFVKDLQEKFTVPIEKTLDGFLEKEFDEHQRPHWKKMFMVTIANSILLKSGSSRKELKQAYKGLIADYDKIK